MNSLGYECDSCGACCKTPIIEIDYTDVLREPRIRDVTTPFHIGEGETFTTDEGGPIPYPDPFMAGARLACGKNHPCPFVKVDNLCSIYPTRPNVCVGFEAGSVLCQESRSDHGLSPLLPCSIAKPEETQL